MHHIQTRMALLQGRVKVRRAKRQNRAIATLQVLCSLLLALEIALIASFSGTGQASETKVWLQGAILGSSATGAYLLVALATFSIAVVVTLACIRRNKTKNTIFLRRNRWRK